MNTKKIAFIVVRYGKEINGGAEYHCRMLAERLKGKYDTEIITTCVKNYLTGENYYKPGVETEDGLTIRRFLVNDINKISKAEQDEIYRKAKPPRRLRRFLYRIGILSFMSRFVSTWKWKLQYDIDLQRSGVFYSDDMINYIKENKDKYDVLISITAEYSPFYFSAMNAGEKLISIPTLHLCRASFRGSIAQAISKTKYVGFNTTSEQKLAKKIFGHDLKNNGIISVGIEQIAPDDWETVKKEFKLPDKYLLYVGRLERSKTGKLLSYYEAYIKQHKGRETVPLVAVGQIFDDRAVSPNIIYTGFVTDAQKRSIIQHAHAIINPSKYESLSLIVLEALQDKIPVLVNGNCNVLKEHCKKSNKAILYYTNRRSFIKNLNSIIYDKEKREYMSQKGYEYLLNNYSWDIIIKRLEYAISFVIKENKKSNITTYS